MATGTSYHTPVLVGEVLRYLVTAHDGVYVDATLGGGGHAEAILEATGTKGRLIGIDADADAIRAASRRLERFGERVRIVHARFEKLREILNKLEEHHIAGVLFDLGVSSYQLDEGSRGFSFRANDGLDLRMDRTQQVDARTVVNSYSEQALANIFWKYGEERHARRIARLIVQQRTRHPIDTTGDLVALVEAAVGQRFLTKSLARVFQAIRIEVNNELQQLQTALDDALQIVMPGGRIVVLSYHSLEDRIVKETFKRASATRLLSANKLEPEIPVHPRCRLLTKKPITASADERERNPRAWSAKLRAVEILEQE
jgi:16S rRNA (cytosine1402-N4)-methyltransferase